MTDKDAFGDRMKGYEAAETGRRLDVRLPVYARIDGRCFSKFTRGLRRPFCAEMHTAMVNTAKALVEETHARIGYTQSDEISLVWLAEGDSSIFFDGKVMKMVSVLAGIATAAFGLEVAAWEDKSYAWRAPHFDCRVFNLPSRTEAANAILWREIDATKNAIQMVAQTYFSPKQLHGKTGRDMIAMLAEKGIDFDAFPAWARRGTFVRRVTLKRELTEAERGRILEKHRPPAGTLFDRSEVRAIEMPSFREVSNREGVIFDGEAALVIEPCQA